MIQTSNLPAALRDTGLFCCWRYEERDGKQTKVPYNPRSGGKAQSTNPRTFTPLDVALSALERDGYDGIGVGIFGNLGAIDIDHCLNEDGELSPMAFDVMDTIQGYTEVSPSGKGLRILFTVPLGFQYDTARFYINNQRLGLEIYIAGATRKYVTVTGDAWTPGLDLQERGSQLVEVLEKYMVRPTADKPTQFPAQPSAPVELGDLELIERAKQSKGGANFSQLWAGDTTGYKSHSEADLALCNALAWWTNGDAQQVDRLFQKSGLYREDKWNRRQSGNTYGALTVQNAVQSLRGGYDPQRTKENLHSRETTKAMTAAMMTENDLQRGRSMRPPDLSDAGNAEIFAREHSADLIFTDSLGWLFWNGQKWERNDHQALALGMKLSALMLKEASEKHRAALIAQAEAKAKYAESGDDADGDTVRKADEEVKKTTAYLNHAKASRNAARIRNMLELAKPALVVKADTIDANPSDLNTPAGIVDLNTGKLRAHDPGAYCGQITAAAPGTSGSQIWEDFLDTITNGDGSVKGFLQLMAGMTLFGTVYHEGVILAHGSGRNGKSTFFNALGSAVGDYAGSIAVRVLTTDKNNQGASLATLRGKRLVVTGELEEHQRLSVAMLKQIASTDKLVIEEKYRQPETVSPSHSIVLFTNHLPRVGSTDGGTWRRLTVVPFNATISTAGAVANYADVLARKAGPAILSWAIEGAVNFARNRYKLDVPDVVASATDAYREREDWLTNFINERCVRDPNARVGARALYLEYKAWAQDAGEFVRRESDFTTGMEAAGFQNIRPKNKSTWVGLRIDLEARYSSTYSVAN